MAFDFEAGLSDVMDEIGRLEAEAKRNTASFWAGNGPNRIINAIEHLSAVAQRLHRYGRQQAYIASKGTA